MTSVLLRNSLSNFIYPLRNRCTGSWVDADWVMLDVNFIGLAHFASIFRALFGFWEAIMDWRIEDFMCCVCLC